VINNYTSDASKTKGKKNAIPGNLMIKDENINL
jgi:hypothetical protein